MKKIITACILIFSIACFSQSNILKTDSVIRLENRKDSYFKSIDRFKTINYLSDIDFKAQPPIVECMITQSTKKKCGLYICSTFIYCRRDGTNVFELTYINEKGVKSRDHIRKLCKDEIELAELAKTELIKI